MAFAGWLVSIAAVFVEDTADSFLLHEASIVAEATARPQRHGKKEREKGMRLEESEES